MRETDRLKERYPKSDPYEIHDSFENGFSAGYAAGHKDGVKEGREDGYEAGYDAAKEYWQEECRQLRECLSALLDK